ncbi:TPA: SDR family NAD(P)-dependent oxidoreductase [Vibrio cholerae]|uniref:SDR family NAD(P)-dependent oxidoreductase n=1 Tax=Vibrio cholerae TaxID=666 RepID=UPI001C0F3A91|nr:SDR family oxidoreductase [Vibrio cholerae]
MKTAIVTGGSRGIGAAIALKLASTGVNVIIIYKNNKNQALEVVNIAKSYGVSSAAFQADVGSQLSVKNVIDKIVREYSQIDILINCAGIFLEKNLTNINTESIDEILKTNFYSVIYMTQSTLHLFPITGGRIVNISSNLIYKPRISTGMYAASKAAVSCLTHAFALELGTRNITVNAVAPSMIITDMTASVSNSRRELVRSATPLGRIGEPEDVADLVALLTTDEARWITGRTILADGGMS